MQTQTPQAPQVEERTRRPWLIALISLLVVIVVGFGTWAVISLTQPDDLTTATDLVDQWVDGWNAEDPDAIVAILTQDASYRDPNMQGGSDRDQIHAFAELWVGRVSNLRHGAGRVTETGTFVFPFSFDYDTGSHAGEIEVELDGDLVSRIHWLYWE